MMAGALVSLGRALSPFPAYLADLRSSGDGLKREASVVTVSARSHYDEKTSKRQESMGEMGHSLPDCEEWHRRRCTRPRTRS